MQLLQRAAFRNCRALRGRVSSIQRAKVGRECDGRSKAWPTRVSLDVRKHVLSKLKHLLHDKQVSLSLASALTNG